MRNKPSHSKTREEKLQELDLIACKENRSPGKDPSHKREALTDNQSKRGQAKEEGQKFSFPKG